MKAIWVIAKNTYREIIRDRILYGLFVFAILLILLSLALGQLSYSEQARISVNFGFTAIHISAAILAIFVGSTLVGREIEKKTILTLLARPISRTQFIVGKSCGLLAVIFVAVALLSVVLYGILVTMEMAITPSFFVGIFGVLVEAAILLAVTLFFGSFSSPMLSVSFSIGVFLLGHWMDSLKYFSERSQSVAFQNFGKAVRAIMPNLELFNWRSLLIYGDPVPVSDVVTSSIYGFFWCVFFVTVSAMILRGRDLG